MEKDDHKLCFCLKQGLKEHNIGIKWGLHMNFPNSYPFSQKSGFLGGMKSGALLYLKLFLLGWLKAISVGKALWSAEKRSD